MKLTEVKWSIKDIRIKIVPDPLEMPYFIPIRPLDLLEFQGYDTSKIVGRVEEIIVSKDDSTYIIATVRSFGPELTSEFILNKLIKLRVSIMRDDDKIDRIKKRMSYL